MLASPEHFNFQLFTGFYDAWRVDQVGFAGRYPGMLVGCLCA